MASLGAKRKPAGGTTAATAAPRDTYAELMRAGGGGDDDDVMESPSLPTKGGKRARVEVKLESTGTAEQTFIICLQKFPGGISDAQLETELDMTAEERLRVVQSLAKNGRLQFLKTQSGETAYKLISQADSQKFKGLTAQDRLIYSLIEESTNMGIWIRDIRMRSKLTQPIIQKSIKILTAKQLIKFEKTAAAKNKKVYMLFGLEPAKSVRGAPWVTAGEFDHEFLNKLNSACLNWIKQQTKANRPDVSPEQVLEFIKGSGVFDAATMTVEDASTLLLTMVYDGLLEHSSTSSSTSFLPFNPDDIALESKSKKKSSTKSSAKNTGDVRVTSGLLFRVTKSAGMVSSFTTIPCALCPVSHVCAEGNVVSPSTCDYYRQWMENDF